MNARASNGVPLVVGLMVETVPGRAEAVSARLAAVDGLEVVGGDGERKVAAVWAAADSNALSARAEALLRDDADILGLFPTFVGQDEQAKASGTAHPTSAAPWDSMS